jgi:hypothetical protein
MEVWRLDCAGGIDKVLRAWWLQKTQEFVPGHTFNEGTQSVCVCMCVCVCVCACVCVCVYIYIYIYIYGRSSRKGKRICSLQVGLAEVFRTLLVPVI